MKINKGYSIIELLLALCIMSILLPSMITVIISSFRYIAITLNQQLRIQDHLFIDHLMRQEIAKSSSYQFKNNTLTPWCTCSGSNVCAYYADKYKDGTHVAFVNNPNSINGIQIAEGAPSKCEPYFRDKFEVIPHGTPGVKKLKNKKELKNMCDEYIKSI